MPLDAHQTIAVVVSMEADRAAAESDLPVANAEKNCSLRTSGAAPLGFAPAWLGEGWPLEEHLALGADWADSSSSRSSNSQAASVSRLRGWTADLPWQSCLVMSPHAFSEDEDKVFICSIDASGLKNAA
jgi:hypothetical protein